MVSPSVLSHESHCEDSVIGDQMKTMKDSMKGLAQSAKKGDFASALSHTDILEKSANASINEVPIKLKTLPADEQAVAVAGYQKEMNVLIDLLQQAKQAATAENQDQLMGLVKQLGQQSKSSHREYRLKCDD